ncbi:MAG: hypothetical protein FD170_2884 [Bacteroidetes bacterium]|nr:MAG: hypothetical protein FD170_2884 [Bacteroidota bacterium]
MQSSSEVFDEKEITFGELTALGGSVPHPPVFTDKPVIPNATTWREESAKLVARTEQTSNIQQ